MKKSIQNIFMIGRAFILIGVSVIWVISFQNEDVKSNFWNINTTYAAQTASYTAPNGKKFIIIKNSETSFTFKNSIGVLSSSKFSNYQSVINYISTNNQKYKNLGVYTTPNGKKFTILQDLTNNTYIFKRPDGTLASISFKTRNEIASYLSKNNAVKATQPSLPVKTYTPPVQQPVIQKPIVTTPPVIKQVPKVIVPPAPTPAPAPVVKTPPGTTAPKVDTATRAS